LLHGVAKEQQHRTISLQPAHSTKRRRPMDKKEAKNGRSNHRPARRYPHFTKKEIRKAKWFVISGLIIVAHGIVYYIFHAIWLEVFD
jgi:hypothetical protein